MCGRISVHPRGCGPRSPYPWFGASVGVLLRVRGATLRQQVELRFEHGSFPRVSGRHIARRAPCLPLGFTPASAGVSVAIVNRDSVRKVYRPRARGILLSTRIGHEGLRVVPRARGALRVVASGKAGASGCPPCARGTLAVAGILEDGLRFIPVCAGRSCCTAISRTLVSGSRPVLLRLLCELPVLHPAHLMRVHPEGPARSAGWYSTAVRSPGPRRLQALHPRLVRYGPCGAAAATALTSVFRTLTGSSPSKSRSVDGRLSPAWNRRAVPPFSAQGFRASSISAWNAPAKRHRNASRRTSAVVNGIGGHLMATTPFASRPTPPALSA